MDEDVYASFRLALSTKKLRYTKASCHLWLRAEQRVDVFGGVTDVLRQHGIPPLGHAGHRC